MTSEQAKATALFRSLRVGADAARTALEQLELAHCYCGKLKDDYGLQVNIKAVMSVLATCGMACENLVRQAKALPGASKGGDSE